MILQRRGLRPGAFCVKVCLYRSRSVPFCVKVLLRAWSEEEMVSWLDLFLQLLSAIILHSHDRRSMISVISLRHLVCHAFRLKLGYRSS